jgi:plastocyanin
MRGLRSLIGVLLVIAAAGLGVGRAEAANAAVAIQNISYQPATVTIQPGDTVVWTHADGETPHTVTSDTGAFDSSPTCAGAAGCMTGGDTFNHTFNAVGSFAYHCKIHSSMHGTVVVQAATTTTRATTTTTRPTTTSRATTSTVRSTTSSIDTSTTAILDLETTTSEDTTSTTGNLAINEKKDGGTNGAAVAALIVAILGVLGGGGYALYRLRAGRF